MVEKIESVDQGVLGQMSLPPLFLGLIECGLFVVGLLGFFFRVV